MLREPLTLHSADGLALEGELVVPDEPWAAALLTHPHPRHGGNMRSMMPGELIKALPEMGVATLRFNFRGMGASEGSFEDGDGERLDIVGALDTLHDVVEGLPIAVCGSSFGADTSLTVADERIAGWCAMAPPLREHRLAAMHEVGVDPRPKLLVIAERDQFRDPEGVRSVTHDWSNTTIEVIPGADHFYVGRVELVVAAACQFVRTLSPLGSLG
jgi:uncharacterized protein